VIPPCRVPRGVARARVDRRLCAPFRLLLKIDGAAYQRSAAPVGVFPMAIETAHAV
jgi:hypothetical protein